MRRSQRAGALALALACAAVLGCRRAGLPAAINLAHLDLQQAARWSRDDVSGVVFVPPQEKLEAASLQLGVMLTSRYDRAADMHAWSLREYRRAEGLLRYHTLETGATACKIGRDKQRSFVAVHVCRDFRGVSSCAEADERIEDAQVERCMRSSGEACWEQLCSERFDAWRANLELILDDALGLR